MVNIKADVEVNLNVPLEILSQANFKKAEFALADQMLADMNNYVPEKGGELRTSGHVENDNELVWNTPYARAQYEGTAGKPPGVWHSDKQRRWFFANLRAGTLPKAGYTTPGTGPYWDKVASGNHMSDWENVYLKGLGL